MNYSAELKKFVTSQHMYSAVRITLACVIPSIVLVQLGIFREYFLFPLGTSFLALTDLPGPFIRRRNSFILAIFVFLLVAIVSSLVAPFWWLAILLIIILSLGLSIIGVYGIRLATVGALALVVMSIFLDQGMINGNLVKQWAIFFAGCVWFLMIFLVVTTLQPYKLASQMIGENYIKLAQLLRIRAKFYDKGSDISSLLSQVIKVQVEIKNLQEETRETVFKTRKIVNESTTTSRVLMLTFLNSIDLHEKLMTSESDYKKLKSSFQENNILPDISKYLHELANHLEKLGIVLQSNSRNIDTHQLREELHQLNNLYFDFRNQHLNSDSLEYFMILKKILLRINEISSEVLDTSKLINSEGKLAKSLSTGLDLSNFVTKQESINLKVLKANISLKSSHFRHAIRIAVAMAIGYSVGQLSFLGIGHMYWILITLIAIMRPAYATTKHRNLLRLYGTFIGSAIAYIILISLHHDVILLSILLVSMILCFTFLRERYFWAVLFMTIYVFLSFNFLKPGDINVLFKDRLIDTLVAGVIAFGVSYIILPVWEHTQNIRLMQKSTQSNRDYFSVIMDKYSTKNVSETEYRLKRKSAIIDLANMSDNFQRMLSEPKNQQKKLEAIHQFVATSHLITAYTASLSQHFSAGVQFPEIDTLAWRNKIELELSSTLELLKNQKIKKQNDTIHIEPNDTIDHLLFERKSEILENEIYDRRNPRELSYLSQLKNTQDIFELLYDAVKEQRKVVENYYKDATTQQW